MFDECLECAAVLFRFGFAWIKRWSSKDGSVLTTIESSLCLTFESSFALVERDILCFFFWRPKINSCSPEIVVRKWKCSGKASIDGSRGWRKERCSWFTIVAHATMTRSRTRIVNVCKNELTKRKLNRCVGTISLGSVTCANPSVQRDLKDY